MATREFTFENLRDILVNRVGLPDEAVVDDPEATFDDMGLDSLAVRAARISRRSCLRGRLATPLRPRAYQRG